MMHDWPLVIFTLFVQTSVGAFIVLEIARFLFTRKANGDWINRITNYLLIPIGGILVVAFFVSFFHLGKPFRAFYMLSNIGSSWLSRELGLGILFMVGFTVFLIFNWKKQRAMFRNLFALCIGLIGLALIFSMSKIYMLSTVPVWNNLMTPITFFTTVLLLGGLFVETGMVYIEKKWRKESAELLEKIGELHKQIERRIFVWSLVFIGIQVVSLPVLISITGSDPSFNYKDLNLQSVDHFPFYVLRFVLLVLGSGLICWHLFARSPSGGNHTIHHRRIYMIFAVVFISEIIGKALFFASYMRVGI